jgi:hypothetical protein
VNEGTIARSLLTSALDEADPDPRNVTALLDGIAGAFERTEVGWRRFAAARACHSASCSAAQPGLAGSGRGPPKDDRDTQPGGRNPPAPPASDRTASQLPSPWRASRRPLAGLPLHPRTLAVLNRSRIRRGCALPAASVAMREASVGRCRSPATRTTSSAMGRGPFGGSSVVAGSVMLARTRIRLTRSCGRSGPFVGVADRGCGPGPEVASPPAPLACPGFADV